MVKDRFDFNSNDNVSKCMYKSTVDCCTVSVWRDSMPKTQHLTSMHLPIVSASDFADTLEPLSSAVPNLDLDGHFAINRHP